MKIFGSTNDYLPLGTISLQSGEGWIQTDGTKYHKIDTARSYTYDLLILVCSVAVGNGPDAIRTHDLRLVKATSFQLDHGPLSESTSMAVFISYLIHVLIKFNCLVSGELRL